MKIYSGDAENICIEEGTAIIIGAELKMCGVQRPFQYGDSVVCIPYELRGTAKTVKMPDSVRYIGGKAFEHFGNLTEVTFSSNLETIGISAFLNCNKLTTLHLPKSIKKIETWAFGNTKIENLYYDGTLFDADKIDTRGAFRSIGKLHCTDCVVDFDQKQFYISEYEYKGTMAEWEATMNEHWVYRRTAKVICSDGVIDNTIIKKKGRKN